MKQDFDKRINVLNYWIDVESSTPPIIKTSNFTNKNDSKWNQNISFIHKDDLLWREPLSKNIKNPKNWVHKIFLGIFNTKFVIEEFSPDDLTDIKYTHETCLVSFLVDGDGFPISKTIRIPDYLKSIAMITIKEPDQAKLFDVRIQDLFATWSHSIKNNKEKLNTEVLLEFLNKILLELNWDLLISAVKDSGFKSLAYSESINLESLKEEERPKFETSDITSSLIVDDLINVKKDCESGIWGNALSKYLSYDENIKNKRIDVIKDRESFIKGLDIDKMPLVCWPFKNNSPLVSLQQYSVNTIFDNIENDHLLSINGAPGTGKTTLLKDIIANIIFQRAENIIKFKNNPQKAFNKIGETSLKLNSKNIQEIFKLDESISGYEIVVSSSNNGAIENITRELPLKEGISPLYDKDLSYLSEIATSINEKESWGLISASLGNKKNNYNFYSKFLYSKIDENGSSKSIFDYLSKPNFFMEERLSWKESCENFENKLKNVKNIIKTTKKIKEDLSNYNTLLEEVKEIKNNYYFLDKRIKNETTKYNKKIEEAKNLKLNILVQKDDYKKSKNSLFGKSKNKLKLIVDKINLDSNKLKILIKGIEIDKHKLKDKKNRLELDKNLFNSKIENLKRIKELNNIFVKDINQDIPFESFWDQEYNKVHKASPWQSKELNKARTELFIASINLHKSFLIENSDYISSNLNAFKQVLSNSFDESETLSKSIWETVFLVVPVISTTFSSFDKLFGNLKSNSLGWLLIDEAGQATPQAPVGALWRSKKAIFLGDPLQTQPVVQIEDKLSSVLLKKNNTPKYWSSTMLSAQEIADRNNKFGTEIDLGEKKWVGMPLRVHRRCDEPMFSISNKIAYNNSMIFGKKRARDKIDIEKVIGKTSWFDIDGTSVNNTHWINEEGLKLLEMLKIICSSKNYDYGSAMPNIYIITPFKNISFELKKLLASKKEEWKPKDVLDKEFDLWIEKSIGTIHSFQGEETDVVFLILGGNTERPNAISWVCEEPNILNVAATRAIKAFYIIGNKKIWNSGVFGIIKNYIK